MTIEKENFLRTKLVPLLQKLDPATIPGWGKMNVHQMIEHYTTDGLMIANGRANIKEIITSPEKLIRYREFLMSERTFQENTVNPLLSVEPGPTYYKTVQGAIGALQQELILFFDVFEKDPSLVTRNPIFGDLNFEENVQLLHKHALHHLKQFGIQI